MASVKSLLSSKEEELLMDNQTHSEFSVLGEYFVILLPVHADCSGMIYLKIAWAANGDGVWCIGMRLFEDQ